jgi:hypothetical protein
MGLNHFFFTFVPQTVTEALDDDALFKSEDGEEDGAFVMYVIRKFDRCVSLLTPHPGVTSRTILARIFWVSENWVLLRSMGCPN